jgi:hypothetical protein
VSIQLKGNKGKARVFVIHFPPFYNICGSLLLEWSPWSQSWYFFVLYKCPNLQKELVNNDKKSLKLSARDFNVKNFSSQSYENHWA